MKKTSQTHNRKTTRLLLLSLGIVVAFCVAMFAGICKGLILQGTGISKWVNSQDSGISKWVNSKVLGIPEWVDWQEKEISISDGYAIRLHAHKVIITDENKNKKWESPKEYHVQDILVADLDSDGDDELIALVWKRGKYGNAMPFWVKENDNAISQHLFIYDLNPDGTASQKWFASEIGTPIRRMKMMEKNPSILFTETIEDDNDLWKWDYFGLKNLDNEVRFIAFGDNIIHKEIYEYAYKAKGGNFDFLYEPFLPEIKEADIAAICAETILVDDESAVSGYPKFGSPLAVGEGIKKAGFDIAVCGNNHALDRGIYGIDVSTNFYKENGITCIGIQNSTDTEYKPYECISRNGIKIALFSYTYGTNDIDVSEKYPYAVHYLPQEMGNEDTKAGVDEAYLDDEKLDEIMKDISRAKEEADVVIVFAHWGEEYSTEISEYQKCMADFFAKAGVDAIIGSHPHVVQPMETLKRPDGQDMTVFYSIGNFRAYQGFSPETKQGAEAILTIEHTFDGVRITSASMEPVNSFVDY